MANSSRSNRAVVPVWTTASEHAEWKKAAKSLKVSLSALVRRAMRAFLANSDGSDGTSGGYGNAPGRDDA